MTETKHVDPLKKRARQRGDEDQEKDRDQEKGEKEKDKGKRKGVFREYSEAILLALLLALFLRAFVVQAFKIPSGSMKETLQIGDHILVNKLLYRTWTKGDLAEMFEVVPIIGEAIRSLTQILPFNYHFRFKDVKRGDVLVFKFPRDESRDFIKRVVGLPGESVEVRGQTVFVNGKPLVEPYAKYNERGAQGAFATRDKFGPVRVPEGHLFMMGDNRDNSLDSRAWGFLNMDKVRGEAFIIYWSCKQPGLACLLPQNVRWGRFGKRLL
jgi:signal peptidase I